MKRRKGCIPGGCCLGNSSSSTSRAVLCRSGGLAPSLLRRALLSRHADGVASEKGCSIAGELEEQHGAPC